MWAIETIVTLMGAAYLMFIVLGIETENLQSAIVFKWFPLILAVSLLWAVRVDVFM